MPGIKSDCGPEKQNQVASSIIVTILGAWNLFWQALGRSLLWLVWESGRRNWPSVQYREVCHLPYISWPGSFALNFSEDCPVKRSFVRCVVFS